MFRIIAFDGGGIRSVFQARILQRLINEGVPKLISNADMYAGTSGGAIVAAGLAIGKSPAEIESLFVERSSEIFEKKLERSIKTLFGLAKAKYDNDGIKRVFKDVYGNIPFSSVTSKRLLVTSFDLGYTDKHGKYWRPKVYHNIGSSRNETSGLLRDIVINSSAAPTFFPSSDTGFIDGGVWCNNPSLAAISEIIRPYSGNRKLEDICLLSIGTGYQKISLPKKKNDWGLSDWAKDGRIIDLLMDAPESAIHYYAESILGVRYHRINTKIPEIKLDAADRVDEMLEIAESYPLTESINWLNGFWWAPQKSEAVELSTVE